MSSSNYKLFQSFNVALTVYSVRISYGKITTFRCSKKTSKFDFELLKCQSVYKGDQLRNNRCREIIQIYHDLQSLLFPYSIT